MIPSPFIIIKYATLLTFLIFSHVASAKIYKWIDEDGNTHYGQQPISGVGQKDISQKIQQSSETVKFNRVESTSKTPRKSNIDSQHLLINIKTIKYDIDSQTRKKIKRQIRAIHRSFMDWFDWNPPKSQKIRIKIFGKYKDFENYQIQHNGRFSTHRSHYNGKTREILMHGTEFKDATLGVLFHEASHAIIHMGVNHSPKWINEGLAEVFELSEVHRGVLKISNNKEWVERIKHKLREGSLLKFKEYINITTNSWHNSSRREERAYYYIAWSMMKFLLSNENRRIALKNIIHDTRRTAWWKNGELEKIFNTKYPGGINKLNRDWRKWIIKQR